MKEQLTPYPYTENENEETVERAMKTNLLGLLQTPLFKEFDRNELMSTFGIYYDYAKELFTEEEKLRAKNVPGANLYYHCKPHSVFQTPYDAISIVHLLLQRTDPHNTRGVERPDPIFEHITPEVVFSIILGTIFHDTGHVTDRSTDNYAARIKVHVEESKKMFATAIELIGLPDKLDREKIIKLGQIGIHGTYFPFTTERSVETPGTPSRLEELRDMLDGMPQSFVKQAHIVRLAVQLADLGGQCARPDYFPYLVKKLRDEFNCEEPGKGTKIIGENHELKEKREKFIRNAVMRNPSEPRPIPNKTPIQSQAPNVELTALAFFGEEKSKPFRDAWLK